MGNRFLQAVAVADSTDPEPWTRGTLLIGGTGHVGVAQGVAISARFDLRPSLPTGPADPPRSAQPGARTRGRSVALGRTRRSPVFRTANPAGALHRPGVEANGLTRVGHGQSWWGLVTGLTMEW
ncbi:hypothetical protein [Micromonospora sp. NPDC092111]|uniref:hypothetical protein n=1 Tax=Micromonospora sp. NPDC092111 TaxID=3364289 RepID=UPI0038239C3F